MAKTQGTIDVSADHARTIAPVLVLGGGITALGVARSLGPLGIPVFGTCRRTDLAAFSRWMRVLNGGIAEFSSAEQLGAFLAKAQFERMVLLPCSDSWAEAVAMLPAVLAARFPSYVSSLEVLRSLTDKERFASLVREHEVPHPLTLFVHDASDLNRYDLRPDTQYFLKARKSQQFIAKTGVKAYMVASIDEAYRRVSELSEAGLGVVLQEFVPGPPTNHYFVDGFAKGDGSVYARFVRQRLRMSPPYFGNSSYMKSVASDDVPDICATVDRLVRVSGLRGIFSVELKRDEHTQIAKVLEVNARAWWYVNFATRCGVNVCEMSYRAAQGEPLPTPNGTYLVGRTCVYFLTDYRACRELRRTGGISIADCLRSWFRGQHAVASLSDPLAIVPHMFELIGLALQRAWAICRARLLSANRSRLP